MKGPWTVSICQLHGRPLYQHGCDCTVDDTVMAYRVEVSPVRPGPEELRDRLADAIFLASHKAAYRTDWHLFVADRVLVALQENNLIPVSPEFVNELREGIDFSGRMEMRDGELFLTRAEADK